MPVNLQVAETVSDCDGTQAEKGCTEASPRYHTEGERDHGMCYFPLRSRRLDKACVASPRKQDTGKPAWDRIAAPCVDPFNNDRRGTGSVFLLWRTMTICGPTLRAAEREYLWVNLFNGRDALLVAREIQSGPDTFGRYDA